MHCLCLGGKETIGLNDRKGESVEPGGKCYPGALGTKSKEAVCGHQYQMLLKARFRRKLNHICKREPTGDLSKNCLPRMVKPEARLECVMEWLGRGKGEGEGRLFFQ